MKSEIINKFNLYRISLTALMLFSMLAITPASPARAVVGRCYVKSTASSGGSGASWADAYGTILGLNNALGNANCTEIWVAAGVYIPGTTRASAFALKNGVAIYGGFAGTETARSGRNPSTNETILSGNFNFDSDNTNNAYNVVTASNTDSTAVLDGFTITAGYADGPGGSNAGAGLKIYGSPTLANLMIRNNFAKERGGGLFSDGDPTLLNVTFESNSVKSDYNSGSGGGMYANPGSPNLTNVTFIGNQAHSNGGGLFINGDITLTNVTFSNDNHAFYGGGVAVLAGNPTLTNVTFTGNWGYDGGGMYISDGSVTVQNTILWGNTVTTGGQVHILGGNVVIKYSVIQGGCPAGATCSKNKTTDPKLGTLGNYGGKTETIPLLAFSSAINTGNNAACPATDQRRISRPQGSRCDIGAFEKEHVTMVLKSIGKDDGWVLESGEFSGKGGSKNNRGKVLMLGDNAQDKQYRAILSFDTATIDDNAIITSAVLKVRKAGVVGTNPMNTHNGLVVDIRQYRFSTRATLQLNDFQADPKRAKVGKFAKRLYSGWYRSVLYASGRNNINTTGLTQFRLRFMLDDNDDYGADILKLYSGNAAKSSRPKLIVQYYLP